MKYLAIPEIDIINNAMNFSTRDLHIIGGCDVYTTKLAGDDKKLYKDIDDRLESKHQQLVDLSKSLDAALESSKFQGKKNLIAMKLARGDSVDLNRHTPFGSFDNPNARKTFACLVTTLNATHEDYDFSRVLCPDDFTREVSLDKMIHNVDSEMVNLRPRPHPALPSSYSSQITAANDNWSTRMWNLLDHEMYLEDCEKYTYAPQHDPLDAGETSIWSMHYFFFNAKRRRVCYFWIRALSVLSHSPFWKRPIFRRRSSTGEGASKRAGYWLGGKADDATYGDDDEEAMVEYPESSDDEGVDRLSYSDLDQIRNEIAAGYSGYWGCNNDGANDMPVHGPGSVNDEIGASMEI